MSHVRTHTQTKMKKQFSKTLVVVFSIDVSKTWIANNTTHLSICVCNEREREIAESMMSHMRKHT